MLDLFYDLHIHSCLSPCGSDEATPADIAMLASMLGLNVVALTDHNTCKNCPAFFSAASEVGILPIAGMELTTAEEIHVLCLFPALENAMAFDEYVHTKLFPIANNVEIYGNQLIMNEDCELIGTEDICLINATSIDLYSLPTLISEYSGIIIPAHIDRSAFSLISSLGFIPDDCGFNCVEIKYEGAVENLKTQHPYLEKCHIIHDSDAHYLENISLPNHKIRVKNNTAEAVLDCLNQSH